MKEFPEKVHADRIWTYVSPLLIFLGTIGNILAITVLSRRRSRKSSIAIFLCALGVSDIVHLNTGLLRQWIIAISETDIRTAGNAACKIHVFFVYFSGHCSSWLLVAVTCERFLGVWLPHKVKNGCSPKTACIVIVVLLALLVLVDCNLLFALSVIEIKIDNMTSVLVCGTSHEYAVNWHWIHLSVFCLIPFAILLVGNGSIILRLIKRRNHRKSQTSVEAKVDKTTQVTTLLVVLNIVFFINTLPICIYLIINPDTVDSSEHDQAKHQLYFAIVNMFVFLNSAINFVLYFLTGSRFRADLKRLFCRPRCIKCFIAPKSKNINLSQTTQTSNGSQPESFEIETSSAL